MEMSEKRQICRHDRAMLIGGRKQMSAARTFFVEHIETPTGRMRLVTDDTHRLRAIDWDDCEARMQDLLLRYYGPNAVTLREALRPSCSACARRLL